MSRTTRKTPAYISHSDVSYINRELGYYINGKPKNKQLRKRKNVEQYRQELIDVDAQYYVSKWNYYIVPYTDEEVIKDAKSFRAKSQRDGFGCDTTQSSGYRKAAARTLRLANKRFCKRILIDDWENTAYPSRLDGKKHIWDWW
jgi:hypothetical protein